MMAEARPAETVSKEGSLPEGLQKARAQDEDPADARAPADLLVEDEAAVLVRRLVVRSTS